MKNIIKIKNFLIDLLFPVECVSCQKDGDWLCKECKEKIQRVKKESCPVCDFPTYSFQFCASHKKSFKLERVISPFFYNDPILQKIIKTYKYRFVSELSSPLSEIMALELKKYLPEATYPVLAPVPLFWRRKNWRGFNQAELLAQKIGARLKIPVKNLLKRIRPTTPQVNLKKEEREKNIQNAFKIISQENFDLAGKTIILIDDVATTSSTLHECAKILYSNGARKIWGLVLARG